MYHIKMSKRCLLVFLSLVFACVAQGQVAGETAWQLVQAKGGRATFVAMDYLGDTYEIEQVSATSAFLNIFGPYAALLKSYPISGTVTGLSVDPASGTAYVTQSNALTVFYWDGYSWSFGFIDTVIGSGLDSNGSFHLVDSGPTETNLYTFGDGQSDTNVELSISASSASIDSFGNCLLTLLSGTQTTSTTTIDLYSPKGTLLWTRAYTHSLLTGSRYVGFCEDYRGYFYLAVDQVSLSSPTYSVEAINPSSSGSDAWKSTGNPGTISNICCDDSQLYLAATTNSQSFISSLDNDANNQTGGASVWSVVGSADPLIEIGNGPVALAYNSSAGTASIISYSPSNGAILTKGVETVPTAADEGTLVSPSSNLVFYLGDTGGSASSAFIQKLIYGPALASIRPATTFIGGTSLAGTVNFDQAPNGEVYLNLLSSNNAVVAVPSSVKITAIVTPFTATTKPVDANTAVILTAQQGAPYVQRSTATTVLTAALSSVKTSLTTLTAPQTTTGTIALTGAAGPSGKTVALSSNNAAATVPASLKILANSASGTFTVTSHPVPSNVVVTITATLAGVSKTATITVDVPTLSSFSLKAASLKGGTSTTGTINLTGNTFGATNATVSAKSSSVTVPTTVAMPVGASTATFTIGTKAVTTTTVVQITVTYGSATLSQNITLTP